MVRSSATKLGSACAAAELCSVAVGFSCFILYHSRVEQQATNGMGIGSCSRTNGATRNGSDKLSNGAAPKRTTANTGQCVFPCLLVASATVGQLKLLAHTHVYTS